MEEQFPEVVGISHYEKLWNHLDKRELTTSGRQIYLSNIFPAKTLKLKVLAAKCWWPDLSIIIIQVSKSILVKLMAY